MPMRRYDVASTSIRRYEPAEISIFKKTLSELDPLYQIFQDPRMSEMQWIHLPGQPCSSESSPQSSEPSHLVKEEDNTL